MRENIDQNNSEYGHFLRSASLSYYYSFLCNFLFIHSEASIGIQEKKIFRKHPFISVLKKWPRQILLEASQ